VRAPQLGQHAPQQQATVVTQQGRTPLTWTYATSPAAPTVLSALRSSGLTSPVLEAVWARAATTSREECNHPSHAVTYGMSSGVRQPVSGYRVEHTCTMQHQHGGPSTTHTPSRR
jgi:hypothetical protein